MRHPILTRPVICRAVLVIAGGALAWSNGEAVAAKKFGSMDKALKDEYKRLAEESAEVKQARETLATAEKAFRTAGSRLAEAEHAATDRLKKSLSLEKLKTALTETQQHANSVGGPIREALHQTKAFKAAKDAAAHAEETIREVSADTGLSESERESKLREAVDLLSRPKLLETEAIAANSAAAKAKTEFDKAALELSTATRKIQHDVDEDSEVRTALAEHSRLRGEVNDAKRKLASLLAALRADEAHAANDANALQQMKQNDAVKRQQWKLLPWRRYRPR